jgi:predicted signal transduction protein with EAL and GGDEF domain
MHLRQLSLIVLALSYAYAAVTPRVSPAWQTVNCSVSPITDATAEAASRWAAADVNTAWNAAVAAWEGYTPTAGGTDLTFTEFISNFFNGPDGFDCQFIDNTECSTTVECANTNHPAGLVLVSCRDLRMAKQKLK